MASKGSSRVLPEERMRPVVVNRPTVGAPVRQPVPYDGNPTGPDYGTNGKALGVPASQNAPQGRQTGQAGAKKQRPMYSYNRKD